MDRGDGGTFITLGVNVASVIIGALILLIAISWIELIDALSNQVFFDDKQEGRRYKHELKKKFLSALAVTVLSIFIIIVVYVYYTSHQNGRSTITDDRPYESFYNFPSVGTSGGIGIGSVGK